MIKGTMWQKLSRFPYLFAGNIFFDTVSSSAYQAALSTYNWSHTFSGTNRGVIINVSIFVAGSVTSITVGASNAVFVRTDTDGVYTNEVWKLSNPTAGAQTITVNLSGSLTSIASASSWTGVDQTDMIEANNGANGSGTDATANVTTISDKTYVVAGVTCQDTAITPVSPMRSRVNNTGALGTGGLADSMLKWSAGAVTSTWTDVAAIQSWAVGAVALRPVQAASTLLKDVIQSMGIIARRR